MIENATYDTRVSNETKGNVRMMLDNKKGIALANFSIKIIKHLMKYTLNIMVLMKSIIITTIIMGGIIFVIGITNDKIEIGEEILKIIQTIKNI
jgi:hypothetical protein